MSDTEDLPQLVDTSDEHDDEDDFSALPVATNLKEAVFFWYRQSHMLRKSHSHLVKVTVMAPLTFGTVAWPDHWFHWAKALGWFPGQREERVDQLTDSELNFVDMVQKSVDTVMKALHVDKQSSEAVAEILMLVRFTETDRQMKNVLKLWKQNELIQKWLKQLSKEDNKYEKDTLLAVYLTCSQFAEQLMKLTMKGENLFEKHEAVCRTNNEKIDDLKSKGNEEFKNGRYMQAASTYTQAIRISPYNHVLYGNRAMASLKTKNFRSALADGLRAVILKPDYVKGWYRYAQAYFELKKYTEALTINKRALEICKNNPDADVKDLISQLVKFKEVSKTQNVEVLLHDGKKTVDRTTVKIPNEHMDLRQLIANLYDQRTQDRVKDFHGFAHDPDVNRTCEPVNIPKHIPIHEVRSDFGMKYIRVNLTKDGHGPCGECNMCNHGNHDHESRLDLPPLVDSSSSSSSDDEEDGVKSKLRKTSLKSKADSYSDDAFSEDDFELHVDSNKMKDAKKKQSKVKNGKVKKIGSEKEKSKKMEKKEQLSHVPAEKRKRNASSVGKESNDDGSIKSEFGASLRQASEALIESRSRNAVHQYQKVLTMIEEHSLAKFDLQEMDYVLVKYAMSWACVETGMIKEILEGVHYLTNIMEHGTIRFPLAYYGLGRAFHRQNRFGEALQPVRQGLKLLDQNLTVPVCTWPGTTSVIKETRPGQLQVALQKLLNQCRYPPKPDAHCRYQQCEGYFKLTIYISDPDFQGYVRTVCFAHCIVEFHPECWKKVKSASKNKLSDKDILGGPCFTPDCSAFIIRIQMFDMNGESKKELKTDPPVRQKRVKKASLKIPASSCKKINRKKMRKEARRQRRKEVQEQKEHEALMRELEKVEEEVLKTERAAPTCAGPDDPTPMTSAELTTVPESHVLMTVLKKTDNDQDELYKTTKHQKIKVKRKKERNRVVLNLGEFVGQQEYEEDLDPDGDARIATPPISSISSSSMAGLDDFDEVRSYAALDPLNPFSIPSHLQSDVQSLERRSQCSTPATTDSTQDEVKKQKVLSISENLFSYFADYLREHGPLRNDSVLLQRELEAFPPEACQVISDAGGLANFLIQSLQFAMVDGFVCCMSDAVRAKRMADEENKTLREMYDKDFPQRGFSQMTAAATAAKSRHDLLPHPLQQQQQPQDASLASAGLSNTFVTKDSNNSDTVEPIGLKETTSVNLFRSIETKCSGGKNVEQLPGAVESACVDIDSVESCSQFSGSQLSSSQLSGSMHSGSPYCTVDRISSDENNSAKSKITESPQKKKKTKKKKKKSSAVISETVTEQKADTEKCSEIKEQFMKKVHAMARGDQNDQTNADPVSMDMNSVIGSTAVNGEGDGSVNSYNKPENSGAIPPGFDILKRQEGLRKSRNAVLRSLNVPSDPTESGDQLNIPVHGDDYYCGSDLKGAEQDLESRASSTSSARSSRLSSHGAHSYLWPDKDSGTLPGSPASDIWSNKATISSSTWGIPDQQEILANNRTAKNGIFNDFFLQPRSADTVTSPEQDALGAAKDANMEQNKNKIHPQQKEYKGYNPLGFSGIPSFFNPSSSLVPSLGGLANNSNSDSRSEGATDWAKYTQNFERNASSKNSSEDVLSDIDDIDEERFDERVYRNPAMRPVGSPAQKADKGSELPNTENMLNTVAPSISEIDRFAVLGQVMPSVHDTSTLIPSSLTAVQKVPVLCTAPCVRDISSVATQTEEYLSYKSDCDKLNAQLSRYREEKAGMEARLADLMDRFTQLQNTSNMQIQTLEKRLDDTRSLNQEKDDWIASLRQELANEMKKSISMKKMASDELKTTQQKLKTAEMAEERLMKQVSEKDDIISEIQRELHVTREVLVSEKQKLAETMMSLSEKRNTDTARAIQAEVALLELKQEVGSQILERSLKDAEHYASQCARHITKIQDEHLQPVPPGLLGMYEQWKTTADKIRETKRNASAAFEEQIGQVKQGSLLSSLPKMTIPCPPPAPEIPLHPMLQMHMSGLGAAPPRPATPQRDSNTPPDLAAVYPPRFNQLTSQDKPNSPSPPPSAPSSANIAVPALNKTQPTAVPRPPGFMNAGPMIAKQNGNNTSDASLQAKSKPAKNSFEKILDTLGKMFPHLSRSELTNFIQQLRDSRKGSLSGMTLHDIVQRVAETILKEQQTKGVRQKASTAASRGTYQNSQAKWGSGTPGGSTIQAQVGDVFEEEEDPCIICHDELMSGNMVRLDCQHRFHDECIRKWFREQSTCPTCRIHSLLPDDFPTL